MVGGGFFVGSTYWYLYLTGEVAVQVSFDKGSLQSAMEAGGPMRERRPNPSRSEDHTVIEGQDPNNSSPSHSSGYAPQQPTSGNGHLMSAFGKEFSDNSPYTQTHAERTRSRNTSQTEKV